MGRSWNDEYLRSKVLTDPRLRKGHAHPLKHKKEVVCPLCNGKGVINTKPIEVCYECDGTGYVQC